MIQEDPGPGPAEPGFQKVLDPDPVLGPKYLDPEHP